MDKAKVSFGPGESLYSRGKHFSVREYPLDFILSQGFKELFLQKLNFSYRHKHEF